MLGRVAGGVGFGFLIKSGGSQEWVQAVLPVEVCGPVSVSAGANLRKLGHITCAAITCFVTVWHPRPPFVQAIVRSGICTTASEPGGGVRRLTSKVPPRSVPHSARTIEVPKPPER